VYFPVSKKSTMGMISAREWDNKIIDHGEGIRNTEEFLDLFDLASSDSLRYCIVYGGL